MEDTRIGIIGLGYVGLPLAVEFAKLYPVIGFDINQSRVDELNTGHDSTLEVEDDGVGFDVPPNLLRLARQDHLGIAGAAERAELLGGKLTIRSIPGKGTLVHAVIPLKPFEDPAIYELR